MVPGAAWFRARAGLKPAPTVAAPGRPEIPYAPSSATIMCSELPYFVGAKAESVREMVHPVFFNSRKMRSGVMGRVFGRTPTAS